jgi:formiminotetrahydrofolate cyclodeaminase
MPKIARAHLGVERAKEQVLQNRLVENGLLAGILLRRKPVEKFIQAALIEATRVPLETLRAAREVAALAARAAEAGNRNAASDAGVGALLAGAAARGAAYNVRINVAGTPNPAEGAPLAEEATRLVEEAEREVTRATAAVEAAIGG